jgi:hypothetical protein
MFRPLLLICLVVSFAAPCAYAKPDQVIIIRHGEKPDQGADLSPRGRQRAAALAPFFLDGGAPSPVAIYAQRSTDQRPSRRPLETVAPLARELKLDVKTCDHDDYAAMVKEILGKAEYDGKVVLICWEHKAIPDLAAALGVDNPPAWRSHAYDRIWIVKLKDGKATLQDLPQRLLFGDSAE